MTTEVEIVQNDKSFDLNFTVKNASNTIVDLTGLSAIKLKVQKYETATLFCTISGVVVAPATAGTCKFTVGNEFVGSCVGDYIAEIEITYTNGQVITAPDIKIKVISDLPK
jgi:hypothetical protein